MDLTGKNESVGNIVFLMEAGGRGREYRIHCLTFAVSGGCLLPRLLS